MISQHLFHMDVWLFYVFYEWSSLTIAFPDVLGGSCTFGVGSANCPLVLFFSFNQILRYCKPSLTNQTLDKYLAILQYPFHMASSSKL